MADLPEKPKWPSDRSERARALVAAGKIGGSRPGSGRPRVPRATEVAAEQIRGEGRAIANAIKSALRDPSPHVRLKAAEAALKLDKAIAEEAREEAKAEAESFDRERALRTLARGLTTGPAAGIIRRNLAGVTIEGTAHEVPADDASFH